MDELAPYSPPPTPTRPAAGPGITAVRVVVLAIVAADAVALLLYFFLR